jgi:2-polyprenyl-3-methyl-5-hydroxy-6-metoxy-1,4-benzoquinol methylase
MDITNTGEAVVAKPAAAQDSYYEQYWRTMAQWASREGQIDKLEAQIFSRQLTPGNRCLDYGCGDGLRYGRFLTRMGINYTGADISEEALKISSSQGLNVGLLAADGTTPFEAASFDAALCMEVFEHLIDPNRAVAELHRILRPGATLITSVPNAAYWVTRVEFLLRGFLNPGGSLLTSRKAPWMDPHIRFFSTSTFAAMIRSGGFQVQQVMGPDLDLGMLPYVFKRPGLSRAFTALSTPIAWLGRVWPSLFGARLFIIAKKV